MSGVTELLLRVTADPSGLQALATQFEATERRIVAAAQRSAAAIKGAGGGSGSAELARMKSELDQVSAATRTLSAAQEQLTQKVEEGGRRRAKASGDALKAKAAEADAIKALEAAESRVTQMIIADQVKTASTRGRLAQQRVASDAKAAADQAAAETQATQMILAQHFKLRAEMDRLRRQRVADDAKAAAASTAAEQAATLALLNQQIAANARLASVKGPVVSHTKAEAVAYREAHSAARGLSGGLGLLWTTYGSIVPLLAGFAVASGVQKSVKAMADFQYQMTFVGALTRKETESMGQAMERMGSIGAQVLTQMERSLFAPKEGAEGLRQLAQAGLTAEQALSVLPAVLDLATVGEMKVADAAFSAVAIMHSFNKETKDMTSVVDMLARAASISTASVGSITESVKQASIVGEQYNVSLEQTLAGLTLLADRGIRGTAAGTAFRNMIVELYSATGKAADIMKRLGVNTFDATGQMRPLEEVMKDLRGSLSGLNKETQVVVLRELFNERSRKAASAYLDELDRLPEVMRRIQTSAGFAKDTTDALLLTVKGEWQQAMNSLEAALIRVGEQSSGPLLEAVKRLKEAFRSEEFQKAAAAIVSGFANVAAWIAQNGNTVITFVEALLAYKAGKFLWSAATAGLAGLTSAYAALSTAMAGGAVAWAAKYAGAGGLIGAALLGGVTVGMMVYNIETIAASIIDKMTPAFALIERIGAGLARIARLGKPGTAEFDGDRRYVTEPGIDYGPEIGVQGGSVRWETDEEVLARRNAGNAERLRHRGIDMLARARSDTLPGAYDEMGNPLLGYGMRSRGMSAGTGTMDLDSERKAWDAVASMQKRYRQAEQESKAHFDREMTLLRAYHDAHIISDEEFNARADAVSKRYYAMDMAQLTTYIADLKARRSTVEELKRNDIDDEIARASKALTERAHAAEIKSYQDLAKQIKEYTNAGKTELDTIEKKNLATEAEIAALKSLDVSQKDSAVVTADAAIKKLELARATLLAKAASEDFVGPLTIEQQMTAAGVKTLDEYIAKLKEARDVRVKLGKELVAVENSWQVGAVQGLQQYLDTGLSTAKMVADAFKKGFGAMEDMLVDWVKTGKLNFKDFIKSIGDDLLRMLIRLNITQPLARFVQGIISGGASGGSGGGGILGNVLGSVLGGFANSAVGGYLTGALGVGGLWGLGGLTAGASGTFGVGVGASAGAGFYGAAGTGGTALAGNAAGATWLQAIMPYLGWIAVAIAAAAASIKFYGQGFRNEGLPSMRDPQYGWASTVPDTKYRLMRAFGMSDRAADIMSGGPIITRLFGHSNVRGDAWGMRGSFGASGVTGENWNEWSRRGGTFRSDIRGTRENGNANFTPLTTDQNEFLGELHRVAGRTTSALGRAIGVDASAALKGYSKPFDFQLSENGEPLKKEDIAKLFGEFMGSVLQDQVSMVLSAGGKTNLADYVRNLKATGDDLTALVLDLVAALEIGSEISKQRVSVEEILAERGKTQLQRAREQGESLVEMAGKSILTAESMGALQNSTMAFRESMVQLILDFENAKSSIDAMFADTTREIILSGLDDQGKYDFYQTEADKLFEQALASGDAGEIQRYSQMINRDIMSAFNLLSPEQQNAKRQEYLTRIETVNAALQARLTALEEEAEDTFNDAVDKMDAAIDKLIEEGKVAADKQVDAANTQLEAAREPVRVVLLDARGNPLVTGD